MNSARSFRWLHFSDLHTGVLNQAVLWPRFHTLLLKDLDIVLQKTNGVDFIVFSGDIVQKGAVCEFAAFDDIIGRILDKVAEFGSRPKLIAVPGNHDLVRPGSVQPEVIALAQFWQNQELRKAIWASEDNSYRRVIAQAFGNFERWREGSINHNFHITPECNGLLPGDASYIVETPSGRIGLIGLNSSWLQLGAGDYERHLHVDARQLLAVTDQKPDEWVKRNDVNLLITHHPAQWLHADSPTSWDSDVNPAGRFDLHLFGHMHEPMVSSVSLGGGRARRSVQAPSLFGLEKFDDGHDRIQGYSLNQIEAETPEHVFTCWPRRLVRVTGGDYKLVPDGTQDLNEASSSFSIIYRPDRDSAATATSGKSDLGPPLSAVGLATSDFDLAALRYLAGDKKAHHKVRRLEQEDCVSALRDARNCWLISDWGMGEDGFVAAVSMQLGVPADRIFGIDFSTYIDRDSFLDNLRTRLGVSFQQICESLSEIGSSLLVLRNVDTNSFPGIDTSIEALVAPIIDFSPEAFILIHSRSRPRASTLPVVSLTALDEPDLAIYVRESENGGDRYGKPEAVSRLFRHTDGIPARIDDALRDLEIISIDDLISSNFDIVEGGPALSNVPAALISTVQMLAKSEDRVEGRAYKLLLALSVLPQGEQLDRLKRFLGGDPFFPSHARLLLERSLIDTVSVTSLEGVRNDTTARILVVPRLVRDYIRSITDEATARAFDRKALDLYFGVDWTSGDIASSFIARRIRSPLCEGYEIQNAITLILRTVLRALSDGPDHDAERSIRLAMSFVEILERGDHFRSIADLCKDIIRPLEDAGKFEKELNSFRLELARSLRMVGQVTSAREAFDQVDHKFLDKQQRQSAEIGLALLLERESDGTKAVAAARRAIAIDRHSRAALHAEAIIAAQIEDRSLRIAELEKVLETAQRRGATTLTNNILIDLAREKRRSAPDSRDLLKQVIQSSRNKSDFYNTVRAIVELANMSQSDGHLADDDRSRLIEAYHFLYNERLYNLFDSCHDALWRSFEINGETTNLLNLFRHSSFIWRLSGREQQELKYLKKLVTMLDDLLQEGIVNASRAGAYFVVRVSMVIGTLPEATPLPG